MNDIVQTPTDKRTRASIAGARGRSARPLTTEKRMHNYYLQTHRSEPTARQWRRIAKKGWKLVSQMQDGAA